MALTPAPQVVPSVRSLPLRTASRSNPRISQNDTAGEKKRETEINVCRKRVSEARIKTPVKTRDMHGTILLRSDQTEVLHNRYAQETFWIVKKWLSMLASFASDSFDVAAWTNDLCSRKPDGETLERPVSTKFPHQCAISPGKTTANPSFGPHGSQRQATACMSYRL